MSQKVLFENKTNIPHTLVVADNSVSNVTNNIVELEGAGFEIYNSQTFTKVAWGNRLSPYANEVYYITLNDDGKFSYHWYNQE